MLYILLSEAQTESDFVFGLLVIAVIIFIEIWSDFKFIGSVVKIPIYIGYFIIAIVLQILKFLGLYKEKESPKIELTEADKLKIQEQMRREKEEERRREMDRMPYDHALITRAETLIQVVEEADLKGYLGRSVGDIKLYSSLVTNRLYHRKLVSECDYLEELLITEYRLAIMNTPTGYHLLMIHNR